MKGKVINLFGDLIPRKKDYFVIHIPNRTFLVCFSGISGEFVEPWFVFWRDTCSQAKIPMARPNEPDMLPKRTKKIRLGIYRTQIQPKI